MHATIAANSLIKTLVARRFQQINVCMHDVLLVVSKKNKILACLYKLIQGTDSTVLTIDRRKTIAELKVAIYEVGKCIRTEYRIVENLRMVQIFA